MQHTVTQTKSRSRILRSTGAILAGVASCVLLSIGTDAVMHGTGVFPATGRMSDPLFLFATAYRALYGILGSYIAARLAPDRPMMHAMILGGLGLLAATAGLIATWNATEMGPRWYPIALVVLTIPQTWVGAKIAAMQLKGASQ